MNDSEINIAIAQWAGWIRSEQGWRLPPCRTMAVQPPDYCRDLNAIHAAESKIIDKPEVWNEYVRKVHWVVSEWVAKNLVLREQLVGTAIHATARQRAEALLRTIGKWKD